MSLKTLLASEDSRATWTASDKATLIAFLRTRHAEAGDGTNFKAATWTAAAAHMVTLSPKSAVKTAASIKNKWGRLKEAYLVVSGLKNQSGFKWDKEKGADIQLESEWVWAAYIEKHPKAKPYRNRGWPHYTEMSYLMPTTVKGTNVFRAPGPLAMKDVNVDPISTMDKQLSNRDLNIDPALYDEEDTFWLAVSNDQSLASCSEEQESPISWSRSPSLQHEPLPGATSLKRTCSVVAPTPSKRVWNNSASAALQGLTSELQNFGATFLEGISATATPLPTISPSPVRKTKAIQQAQELEEDLDDESLAKLIRIFQSDVNAADAYVVIKRNSLHKAWILSTLGLQ